MVLEKPSAIDPDDHWTAFNRAAGAAAEAKDEASFLAFKLMGGICSMALVPDNPVEPFRAKLHIDDKRSMIPDDLLGEQRQALAAITAAIKTPALRARIADLCWTADRQVVSMGELAVSSYLEALRLFFKADAPEGENRRLGNSDAIAALQRAAGIQMLIGWNKPAAEDVKTLVQELRKTAQQAGSAFAFRDYAELDADYEISPVEELADGAEEVAKSASAAGHLHAANELWLTAARFRNKAHDREGAYRCTIEAAEQLVRVAEGGPNGLFQAHWLDRAIATLKRVPGTGTRRKALQKRLLDAQAEIVDQARVVEHKVEVTEIVKAGREALADLPLIDALIALANIGRSPNPARLQSQERKLAGRYVLSSLFATVVHSHDARKTATIPGAATEDKEALRGRIVQSEEQRRKLEVVASENARYQLILQHSPPLRLLTRLAWMSPLVEKDHEWIVAKGLMSYLAGDHLVALHLLIPQLEAGLRHFLEVHGEDVVLIRNNGTQEKAKLGDLLGKFRPKLVELLDEATVFEIENLFARPEGPKLRANLAHGLLPQYLLIGPDAIHACWFIYRLIMLPFIGREDEVKEDLGQEGTGWMGG